MLACTMMCKWSTAHRGWMETLLLFCSFCFFTLQNKSKRMLQRRLVVKLQKCLWTMKLHVTLHRHEGEQAILEFHLWGLTASLNIKSINEGKLHISIRSSIIAYKKQKVGIAIWLNVLYNPSMLRNTSENALNALCSIQRKSTTI